VLLVAEGGGEGAGAGDPSAMLVSKHDTKISSVHLQIHSHRNVTGPVGMPAGSFTACG